MKLKIKITREILRQSMMCGTTGITDINKNCAISLAIRDIMPDAVVECDYINPFPKYYPGTSVLIYDSETTTIVLPKRAKDFITRFDAKYSEPKKRLRMTLIDFEITLPNSVIETINISDIHKSPTLELS